MRSALLLAPLLLGALTITPVAASAPAASPYSELVALEGRIAAIGFRLTTANAAWCPVRQPQFGWIWGDARLYGAEQRAEALAAYHVGDSDAPYIAAIAPDWERSAMSPGGGAMWKKPALSPACGRASPIQFGPMTRRR